MSFGLIILGLTACAVGVSQATSCTSTTANTCQNTFAVAATCTSSVCVCETGFSAVTWGCAVTGQTPVEKPVVYGGTGGIASGQVLASNSLTLTCDHNYTSGVTYAWKKDGTAVGGQTAQTTSVTPASATSSEAYTCEITKGGNTAASDAFTVTGYAAGASAITAVPYVAGVPVSALDSATFTPLCKNQPTDAAAASIAWTLNGASATIGTVTLSSSNAGQTLKCTVTITGGASTLATPDSPTVNLPTVATVDLVEEAAVKVIPTAPVVGGYMAVRCLVRAPSLDGITYAWMYDGEPIAGQVDHTLQINGLVNADHGNSKKYKCFAKRDTLAKNGETANLAIISAVAAPTITTSSANFATGTSYVLICTSPSDSPGIEYEWKRTVTGGSAETLSETSKTLTITATTTSTSYTCAARIGSSGSFGTASSAQAVQSVDVVSVSTVTGPTKPLTGTQVNYNCVISKGDSVTVTYKWLDNNVEISGQTGSSYSFDAGSAGATKSLKCSATSTASGATAVTSTNALATTTVATTEAPTITASGLQTISGTASIQTGGSYSLVCASNTATGQSATFEWTFTPTGGSATTLGTNGNTYTISSAASSNAGSYTCKATVGSSQSAASSALTLTHSTVVGKWCNAVATCSALDLSVYTGNCVNSVCTCMEGVTLSATQCGTTSSASTNAVASLLVVVMAIVASRLF